MQAYLAIKYHADQRNRPAIEAISRILAQHDVETVCIVRDLERWGERTFPPRELMLHSFAALEASDLLLLDLTEKGVGVGIEAGYAHARGIPIVTIAQEGADISDTLRGISWDVVLYAGYDALRARLLPILEQLSSRRGNAGLRRKARSRSKANGFSGSNLGG